MPKATPPSDRTARLRFLLEPESVAIIGASDDPSRIGGRPLRYLLNEGFEGAVYPVNPNRDTVQGKKAFPTITDVPEAVDCAVISVPAKIVPETLEACAASGAKSAIIFSSGFAEMGDEGVAKQSELSAISERTGIRVVGPNCLGLLSFRSRFFPTFSSSGDAGYPDAGPLAIVSQSGAYGTHVYAVARSWGLGVSHVITTGNECDVDVAECISWMADDENVKVIAAYAEGVKDGDALIGAFEKARANKKPIVFMKVGRSEEGAAAAASHTASLAGSDEIYDAVFRQFGVHRASTTEELLDVAYACTGSIHPTSKRIGLITLSGGVGAQMADHAKLAGLDVAPMPDAAQAKLKALLPFASALNPVDTTAHFFNDMNLVRENFAIMLEEGRYDIAVAFFTMVAASPYLIDDLIAELEGIRARFPDRLLFLSLLGPPEVVQRYRDAGYLTYEDPCRAIDAAAAMVTFGKSFAESARPIHKEQGAKTHAVPSRPLSEWASRELMADTGVPLVEAVFATSADQAAEAYAKFNAPVAVKISAPDITHKTEIGGVVLNIEMADEARRAYEDLMSRAKGSTPDGVIVSPMISGGIECILGVQVDPVFGPTIMFGLGGVFVEVFNDVSFRLAPVTPDEALRMIEETKGAALLRGARGKPPSDMRALAEAIVALSEFAARTEGVQSIDLNPFVVMSEGQGAMALDCLIVAKDQPEDG
ncbi:MAG: acetate--CoA ligase family protein [Hyphomicrobiaceae bacterium]|nr:acetate--CoA ligase family protein [Hyphomicrobiaceae bacterium]